MNAALLHQLVSMVSPKKRQAKGYRAHDNARAAARRLRQLTAKCVVTPDMGARLDALVASVNDHDRAWARLCLINQAREKSEATGVSFENALDYLVGKLELEALRAREVAS